MGAKEKKTQETADTKIYRNGSSACGDFLSGIFCDTAGTFQQQAE